jgi:hypothetical protein
LFVAPRRKRTTQLLGARPIYMYHITEPLSEDSLLRNRVYDLAYWRCSVQIPLLALSSEAYLLGMETDLIVLQQSVVRPCPKPCHAAVAVTKSSWSFSDDTDGDYSVTYETCFIIYDLNLSLFDRSIQHSASCSYTVHPVCIPSCDSNVSFQLLK